MLPWKKEKKARQRERLLSQVLGAIHPDTEIKKEEQRRPLGVRSEVNGRMALCRDSSKGPHRKWKPSV